MKLDFDFPGWTKRETDDAWHIWPEQDRIEHKEAQDCPCDPLLEFMDAESGKEVWIHWSDHCQPVGRR